VKIRYIQAIADMLREKTGDSIIAEVSIGAYSTGHTEYKTKLFVVNKDTGVKLTEYETVHELVSAMQEMIDENGESLHDA
jgi:hypothetical protein